MRLLFLDPTSDVAPPPELLKSREHEVLTARTCLEALALVRTEHFDAVVIIEEMENPEILEFTASVHRAQSELPVFLLNDWDSELLAALESPETTEDAG
jgi:DNA-binding response OmpR family regulator